APGAALVHLNGGDALSGALVELNSGHAVVASAGGRLEIPAACVRAIDFGDAGVGDLIGRKSDWKLEHAFRFNGGGRNSFQVEGGRLVVTGYASVSREVALPPSCRLSMEYEQQDPVNHPLNFRFLVQDAANGWQGNGCHCFVGETSAGV